MHKMIVVGDPHAKVSNLDDMEIIIDMVEKKGIETKADYVYFTGDLFDTHGVVRAEVLNFWYKSFMRLTKNFKVLVLKGNHDITLPNKSEKSVSVLSVFENLDEKLSIITSPEIIDISGCKIAFIPFDSNLERFVETSKEMYSKGATELAMAHQNFTIDLFGDMIDMNLVPQKQIVTGHIHKKGTTGKCFEVGTPKYDSVTDANEIKGFHVFKIDATGYSIDEFVSTKSLVTTIEKHIIKEGEEIFIDPSPKVKTHLELVGPNAWISKMKKLYKNKAQIKGSPTDRAHKIEIGNSEDLKIKDYIDTFSFLVNIDKTKVLSYLGELGCPM